MPFTVVSYLFNELVIFNKLTERRKGNDEVFKKEYDSPVSPISPYDITRKLCLGLHICFSELWNIFIKHK